MPACRGYSARHTGESILQAGKFGLQYYGDLDSMIQAGIFGLQRTKGLTVSSLRQMGCYNVVSSTH
ncbi:hypothetical protein DQG23_20405 [Paenibacillus contaminans]|uniref:Uncharacterized protein n=1 Tax=Paenibacillus contaminans TaxID=450362 RepID=A0A329MI73_9BACL|nr:hypothetical protein DQG23_20405 [Paenibacillus contaminans]